jgi:hypothetical protein
MRILESEFNQANIPFSSSDQHIRCLAHIINLAAQEFLRSLKSIPENEIEDLDFENQGEKRGRNQVEKRGEKRGEKQGEKEGEKQCEISVVSKLRKAVVAIRSSPQRRESFSAQCKAHNLKPKQLTLDVCTRWNSTYNMITRALELQLVGILFCFLCDMGACAARRAKLRRRGASRTARRRGASRMARRRGASRTARRRGASRMARRRGYTKFVLIFEYDSFSNSL